MSARSQFNPETPYLHLLIFSAQKLHIPIGHHAPNVARTVHLATTIRVKRIGHKGVICFLRIIGVSPSHTYPTYEQFALFAKRYGGKITVKDVKKVIVYRFTVRDRLP